MSAALTGPPLYAFFLVRLSGVFECFVEGRSAAQNCPREEGG
jgi:hypothetical protein